MTPQRIQLSRKKGWRKPENTVVVARPTKWGNPFHAYDSKFMNGHWSATDAVTLYTKWLHGENVAPDDHDAYKPTLEEIRRELRGKNLACWCKPGAPCHADVLLKIANE